jgi:hypothetical protein
VAKNSLIRNYGLYYLLESECESLPAGKLAHALTLFYVGQDGIVPIAIGTAIPDYELHMRVYTSLYRFVSVCTSLSCSRTIVEDYRDLHPFGGNTGAKTGTIARRMMPPPRFISKETVNNGYETGIYSTSESH